MQKIDESGWIKIVFDYFNSHVKQRFLFINFYILISIPLLSSVYLMNFENHTYIIRYIVIAAYIFEIFITYIFYRLESRTRFLIKNSERVIKKMEKKMQHDESLSLFLHEEGETKKIEMKRYNKIICKIIGKTIYKRIHPILYSECFQLLFAGVAIYSLVVIVMVKYFI